MNNYSLQGSRYGIKPLPEQLSHLSSVIDAIIPPILSLLRTPEDEKT
ncbi:MAG: hypothetical protein ACRD4J_05520 [Nitrososphaeraceae archaeon]